MAQFLPMLFGFFIVFTLIGCESFSAYSQESSAYLIAHTLEELQINNSRRITVEAGKEADKALYPVRKFHTVGELSLGMIGNPENIEMSKDQMITIEFPTGVIGNIETSKNKEPDKKIVQPEPQSQTILEKNEPKLKVRVIPAQRSDIDAPKSETDESKSKINELKSEAGESESKTDESESVRKA